MAVVAAAGCEGPAPPPERTGASTRQAKPEHPILFLDNAKRVRLNTRPDCFILTVTREYEPPLWFFQDESGALNDFANNPIIGLRQIAELSISPDDKYLAVISRGELHPVLQIFGLPDLLSSMSASSRQLGASIATIDPYPGEIGLTGWRGSKLGVTSNMPLDKLDRRTRRVPSELLAEEVDFRVIRPFLWDIHADTITGGL